MDEATLAGIEQRADRMEVLLADSHPDSEPCTLLCEAAADVYDDQRALRQEVRRLSAALDDQQREANAARQDGYKAGWKDCRIVCGVNQRAARAVAAEAALADDLRARVEAHVADLRERHVLRADHFDSLDMDVVCCAVCAVAEDDYPCPDLVAAESLAAALAAAPSGEQEPSTFEALLRDPATIAWLKQHGSPEVRRDIEAVEAGRATVVFRNVWLNADGSTSPIVSNTASAAPSGEQRKEGQR